MAAKSSAAGSSPGAVAPEPEAAKPGGGASPSRTSGCRSSYRSPARASRFYGLKVRRLRGLLLNTAVWDAWSVEHEASDGSLRCEASIPRATLVPLDAATPYRCADGTELFRVSVEIPGETSRIAFDRVH